MTSTETEVVPTDQDLLSAFQRNRDQDAFKALVERHYSMVFGVARRMLGCPHAAEDVLQATFLVLAKDARRIRKRQSLASWLYGFTFRISARAAKQRARTPVSTLKDEVMVNADPLEQLTAQFEHNAVFEELHRLPPNMRTPMVLRYLKGKSNAEVAEELNLSESAVEGRLKRARNQLRMRLARQGVTFATAVAILGAIKQEASATELPEAIAKTVEACCSVGSDVGSDILSNEVVRLAEEEIVKMTTAKLISGSLWACVSVGVLGLGWSVAGNSELLAQGGGGDPFGEVVVQSGGTAQPTQPNRVRLPGLQATPSGTTKPLATITQRLRALGHYSVDRESENELRIPEALQKHASIEFSDTPLAEVVMVLQDNHNLQIVFDKSALEDEGIDPDSNVVTATLSNIKLSNVLKLMLEDLNLATVVRNEVLVITSREVAEETLITRVYRRDPTWQITAEEMTNSILAMAAPNSWDQVGGPGSLLAVSGGLVVSNSRSVHDEMNQLFAQFDRLYSPPGAKALPASTATTSGVVAPRRRATNKPSSTDDDPFADL